MSKFRLPQKNVDAMYIGKSCGNVPCIMDLLVEETGVPGENHRPMLSLYLLYLLFSNQANDHNVIFLHIR
jgi:hypothetical protein